MAGAKIALSASADELQSDGNDNAKVNLPITESEAGFACASSEVDAGTVTGTRRQKAFEASADYRMRAGVDTLLFQDVFAGAAINSALWTSPVTTMTVTIANGFVNLNAGLSTANAAVARVSSYRTFPMYKSFGIYWEANMQFVQSPQANNVCEWGLGIATGTAAPTDGVFFRLNAAGEFRAVINNNGSETQSGTMNFAALVGTSTTRHFCIQWTEDNVKFWIDDVMVAVVDLPTAGALPTASGSLPSLLRNYNSGVTGAAQVMRAANITISCADMQRAKPWGHVMAGMGMCAQQGQTGGTMGTTANYANSANPTAAVPTNTTAALGSGLGGQFWETDTLAVTTDGVISSYQNPAATAALPGKVLYITGVKIESFIQTILTGGGYNASWSLAFGHTAVSLATAEASGSGTKAPRRVALGQQSVAAAAAALVALSTVQARFDAAPIPVFPGEFIQTVKKKVGTAPSAGVVAHLITFDGYWE